MIVQEYVDKPLLVDGYKSDLRIYVLVTSCDPLRVFLYNDGLLRMSTEKYVAPHESNMVSTVGFILHYSHSYQSAQRFLNLLMLKEFLQQLSSGAMIIFANFF